jgi:RluA family pseudouridine synthase
MTNIYTIAYHHQGILVVDKPYGVASQPTQGQTDASDVYSHLCSRFTYVGMHHRLDQVSSGLLLFTTDKQHNATIASYFQEHRITRRYLAWVLGKPSPPLFPSTVESTHLWNSPLDGEVAITRFSTIHTAMGMSLVDIHLETGRTHQIRRHASAHGFPLVGDHKYGGAAKKLWPRLALHAYRLEFLHPATQEQVVVHSPIPSDLDKVIPIPTTIRSTFDIP